MADSWTLRSSPPRTLSEGSSKPIIAIKPLPGGSLSPPEGLSYISHRVAGFVVGIASVEEARETFGLALSYFSKLDREAAAHSHPSALSTAQRVPNSATEVRGAWSDSHPSIRPSLRLGPLRMLGSAHHGAKTSAPKNISDRLWSYQTIQSAATTPSVALSVCIGAL